MPEFVWRAATASGKVERGQLYAPNQAAVIRQVRDKEVTPLAE